MPLHLISSDDLRASCRQRLESCELWLRRLIHDQFSQEFGPTYLQTAQLSGQHIFGSKVRKHAADRIAQQPERYQREIDTLLLDHLASVICKQDVFKKYFADAMRWSFPAGESQLRIVLDRLVPIRNALSHANPLTLHDAERVLCYCDDIIYSLIHFYAAKGMANEFDAPMFTKFSDCFGHVENLRTSKNHLDYSSSPLRAGDSIRLEVEVDAHFPPTEYVVKWVVGNISHGETGQGPAFVLTLLPRHVGETFTMQVTLVSIRNWHRHGNFDAMLTVAYKVLPPV